MNAPWDNAKAKARAARDALVEAMDATEKVNSEAWAAMSEALEQLDNACSDLGCDDEDADAWADTLGLWFGLGHVGVPPGARYRALGVF